MSCGGNDARKQTPLVSHEVRQDPCRYAQRLQKFMKVNFPDFELEVQNSKSPDETGRRAAMRKQIRYDPSIQAVLGLDNITSALFQHSLKVIIEPLTGLLKGCIAVGYTPKQ